jgi:hypothetical protein
MEKQPWQTRAKEAGLPQRLLAWIVGSTPHAVSQGLRGHWRSGVPRYLKAVILAWRIMTPEMRKRWLAELEAAEKAEAHAETDKSPPAGGQGA